MYMYWIIYNNHEKIILQLRKKLAKDEYAAGLFLKFNYWKMILYIYWKWRYIENFNMNFLIENFY